MTVESPAVAPWTARPRNPDDPRRQLERQALSVCRPQWRTNVPGARLQQSSDGWPRPGLEGPAAFPVHFAEILIEQHVITPEDLGRLIAVQRSLPGEKRRTIGELAVSEGYLERSQLQSILDGQGWRLRLGELLVMRGHLTLPGLTRALREQQIQGGQIGEVLLRLGLVGERELAEGLAEQAGVACIPISSIPPDRGLVRWVNRGFAQSHGLAPLTLRGRSLVVAIWQPRSMAAAADIEQSSGLAVNVVLTTRQEVLDRIEAVYGAPEPPA
jgi:hypothetical protein